MINRNDSFISSLIHISNAFLSKSNLCSLAQTSCSNSGNKYIQNLPIGKVPNFENMLPLRQMAKDIAKTCEEVSFKN